MHGQCVCRARRDAARIAVRFRGDAVGSLHLYCDRDRFARRGVVDASCFNARFGDRESASYISYGDPLERPPEAVLEDLADGLTTAELATKAYGVVMSASDRGFDEAATESRRLAMQAARRQEPPQQGRSLTDFLEDDSK